MQELAGRAQGAILHRRPRTDTRRMSRHPNPRQLRQCWWFRWKRLHCKCGPPVRIQTKQVLRLQISKEIKISQVWATQWFGQLIIRIFILLLNQVVIHQCCFKSVSSESKCSTYSVSVGKVDWETKRSSCKWFSRDERVGYSSLLLGFDDFEILNGWEVLNHESVIHWVVESGFNSLDDHILVSLVGKSNKEFSNLASRQL